MSQLKNASAKILITSRICKMQAASLAEIEITQLVSIRRHYQTAIRYRNQLYRESA